MKKGSGIYYLYDDNRKLIYIGKSNNLLERVISSANIKSKSYFARCSFIENMSDMDIYEIYLISIYKPILNKDCIRNDITTISIKEPTIDTDFIRLRGNVPKRFGNVHMQLAYQDIKRIINIRL